MSSGDTADAAHRPGSQGDPIQYQHRRLAQELRLRGLPDLYPPDNHGQRYGSLVKASEPTAASERTAIRRDLSNDGNTVTESAANEDLLSQQIGPSLNEIDQLTSSSDPPTLSPVIEEWKVSPSYETDHRSDSVHRDYGTFPPRPRPYPDLPTPPHSTSYNFSPWTLAPGTVPSASANPRPLCDRRRGAIDEGKTMRYQPPWPASSLEELTERTNLLLRDRDERQERERTEGEWGQRTLKDELERRQKTAERQARDTKDKEGKNGVGEQRGC